MADVHFSVEKGERNGRTYTQVKTLDRQQRMQELGRITGGAGYACIIASGFMGALSGSGPGNAMATGTFTVPPMLKSKFPPELAANVIGNASYLGNVIPPSGNIVAALGAYTALYPDSGMTSGQFWMLMWAVAIWFVLLKIGMCYIFCKIYGVHGIPKEELPKLSDTIKEGWQGLILPVIIFVPFMLDSLIGDTVFAARLGAGASNFSSSMLLFVPGFTALYAMLICKNDKYRSITALADLFAKGLKSLVSTISPCLFGYMIGSLFGEADVGGDLMEVLTSLQLGKFAMVVLVVVVTCFMGMLIPGSSMVVMFGGVFCSVLAQVGVDPLLTAIMLPVICGMMCGITPPLALGMYAGMALTGADFGKTVKNDLWWCAGQFVMEVVVLMGWLPVIGL